MFQPLLRGARMGWRKVSQAVNGACFHITSRWGLKPALRAEPYKRVINVEEVKQVEEVKRKKLNKIDIVLCMAALACTLIAVVMFVLLI